MDGQFCKSWSGWCWEVWKWSLPKKKALSFERLVRFEREKCANRYSHMGTNISSFSVKLEMYIFIHGLFSKQLCFFSVVVVVVVVVVVASKRQRWRVRTRAGDHWSFAEHFYGNFSQRWSFVPQVIQFVTFWFIPQRVTKNCQDSKFFFSEHFRNDLPSHWWRNMVHLKMAPRRFRIWKPSLSFLFRWLESVSW